MSNDLKTNMTSSEHWVRLLHMLLFALALYIAILVTWFLVAIQFLFALLSGSTNGSLLRFSDSFSTFIYQVIRYLTYNSDEKPFPFSDWPEPEPELEPGAEKGEVAPEPEDAPEPQSEASGQNSELVVASNAGSAASTQSSQMTEQTSDKPVESELSPAAANDEPTSNVSGADDNDNTDAANNDAKVVDAELVNAEEDSDPSEEKKKDDPDKTEIDKK